MKKTSSQVVVEDRVSGQANEPMSLPAHALASDVVARELNANPSAGLSAEEAASRLLKYGSNDLGQEKRVSAVSVFAQQIFNSMTLVRQPLQVWPFSVLTIL